jgi:nicotinate-nucleotide pyrophosphorylase (carboxylating)
MNVEDDNLEELLRLARNEDLRAAGDITSRLLPEAYFTSKASWNLTARQAGRFSGASTLPRMLTSLAPEVQLGWIDANADGLVVEPGQVIARLHGHVGQMLSAERTILNFLQRLSGIATLTASFVTAVAGTHAKIYDTRKTTPGFRSLEKYAVRCGGGHNHRVGLYDAVLIKDNHLAGIPAPRLAHAVFEMLDRLSSLPDKPAFVEVECDDLTQLAELLKVVGIDVILLDNFALRDLAKAVELRDSVGLRGKVELEASGGASLTTVRDIAMTGVERIAVGAITHSAPALDLALDATEQ